MRALGFSLVQMKGLRIEAFRESLDLIRLEGVAAERKAFPDSKVVEIFHAFFSRRPMRSELLSAITVTPASSTTSNSILTKPISGRLDDTRVSSTVVRRLICRPGRSGA